MSDEMLTADRIALAALIVSGVGSTVSIVVSLHALKVSKKLSKGASRDSALNELDINSIAQLRSAAHEIELFKHDSPIFEYYRQYGGYGEGQLHRSAYRDFRYSESISNIISRNGLVFVGGAMIKVQEHLDRLRSLDDSDALEFNRNHDEGTTFMNRLRAFIVAQEQSCADLAVCLRQLAFDLEARIKSRADKD